MEEDRQWRVHACFPYCKEESTQVVSIFGEEFTVAITDDTREECLDDDPKH